MADPWTSAAVGVLFADLCAGASTLFRDYIDYEPLFEDLKRTLAALSPLIQNINAQDIAAAYSNEVIENLKKDIVEGLKLVSKYKEAGAVAGCLKKTTTYPTQIRKLDDSLRRQLEILSAHQIWITYENHSLLTQIAEELNINPKDRNDMVCHPIEVEDHSSEDQNDAVLEEIKSISSTVIGPVEVSQGAGELFLFNVLYDNYKKLMSKSQIYEPLLKDIVFTLDSYRPLIKQIEENNEEPGYPKEEVEKLQAHIVKGIKIVEKFSKIRKWHVYKKYKYANKLLGWDGDLARMLRVMQVQGLRDGKFTSLDVDSSMHNAVTGNEMSNIILETGVENIATTSRDMMKVQSGVEITSGDVVEGISRIEDRVSDLVAGIKRIENRLLETRNGAAAVKAWCSVPELPQLTVGLDEPLKELKTKLFRDGVSMLVITAPGGCGKTVLATKFCHDQQVKDKFKTNIFFVTVSNTPNLSLIVQELYNRKGSEVPTFQDEITAVKWLQTFLKEQGRNPLLLVLDDVWSGSESLLDKFQFKMPDMPDYKILVTSRSEFPRSGSSYHLQSLDYENAMKLFYHSASLGDKSSHIPAYLSEKIVERCKGYPLAITVAGGSLCGQSIEIWEQTLIEWSKGTSILDSETELLLRLQSSIVVSDKEMAIIRECFLDLGSFPKDQRIPVTALIDMWTELYEQLDEDTLCVAYVHRLTNRSLANLLVTRKDQEDGYYNEHFVTQHDLLRELAIYETRQHVPGERERLIINITGNNLPKWWMEKKYKSMKARLVSISTDGNFSSKWHHMELPEAEVLVLNFQTKNYALPKFVDTMHKLKVLVVTNGFSPAELSNFALLGSLSHLKRIRLELVTIPSITKNPVQFVCLKKISLFTCTIGKAFSDGSIQFSCAFPNLEEICIDYCNDLVEMPADLCDLIHLRKLSVTNSYKLLALPEDTGKLENLELLRLRSCTSLEQLPGSSRNLKKLTVLDVSNCFSIKELPEDIGEMSSLKKLDIRECSTLQELPVSVLDLQHLEEVICDDETRDLWEAFLPLGYTRIVVVKEDINLNSLHRLHF